MATRADADGDPSNGYEATAAEFMRRREQSNIGLATIRRWSSLLPPGASVLDLGCGHGVPVAKALVEDGFEVYGIDASPTLVEAFCRRFPQAHARCEAVEDSDFFGTTFDGVLAIGLVFLLEAHVQRQLIRKVARALIPGGRFLFTAPREACEWQDVLTGRRSLSLGADAYQSVLAPAGLVLVDEYQDEGDNHYFDGERKPHGA
jgi:SAM-dependent methyltransferase